MVLGLWSSDLTQEEISPWPSWFLINPDVPEIFQCSLALQDVPCAWPPTASPDVRRMCNMAPHPLLPLEALCHRNGYLVWPRMFGYWRQSLASLSTPGLNLAQDHCGLLPAKV